MILRPIMLAVATVVAAVVAAPWVLDADVPALQIIIIVTIEVVDINTNIR